MTEPILSADDLRSPTWHKIKAYVDARLVLLRTNLESDQPPKRTAKLRGQIKELVLLQALGNPAPAIVVVDDEFI